jgi:tetratricopeptide (TPR) repeat protein
MNNAKQLEDQVRRLIQDGKARDAAVICDQLNQQFPEYESGWYTASRLALLINEPAVGVRAIDHALALSPGKPKWLLQRIECMGAMGDKAGAISLAKQLAQHRLDSALLSSQLAYALSKLALFELALPHYQRACELRPDDSRHHYNLATVLRFLGDIDGALRALNDCIRLDPDDTEAHLLRAGMRTQSPELNNVAELESAYSRTDSRPKSRVQLCYALAKELEDLGEYDRSFDYLAEGSKLRRQEMTYDPASDLDTIDTIVSNFGPAQFQRGIEGHINAEPIFVVGMPRTGTTLVERVLGSHSVVQSAGELMTFSLELIKQCNKVTGPRARSAADLAARALSVDFAALGEAYITATRPTTGEKAHFVDKMPLNFLYAGMIHLALPKAKIVLLERDPMDTCYAVFKTLFERVYPFSYDLVELANYFVAYRKLMDHWLETMPGVIHVIRYEDLVTEPRPVIEDLLEHCNLSFEEQCLRFYDNTSPSTTASATQVRRAFSRASIGKWRNYEKQLQAVADILGEAGLLSG